MGIDIDSEALSGVWSGQYWLGDNDVTGVRFSAWVSIENGRLQGSTLEPCLYEIGDKQENTATIRGHINLDEVVFLKTYDGVDHEPGYYEGELSECGQKIIGRWYFGWPDELSGRFEMTIRSSGAAIGAQTTQWAKSEE